MNGGSERQSHFPKVTQQAWLERHSPHLVVSFPVCFPLSPLTCGRYLPWLWRCLAGGDTALLGEFPGLPATWREVCGPQKGAGEPGRAQFTLPPSHLRRSPSCLVRAPANFPLHTVPAGSSLWERGRPRLVLGFFLYPWAQDQGDSGPLWGNSLQVLGSEDSHQFWGTCLTASIYPRLPTAGNNGLQTFFLFFFFLKL